MDINCGDNEWLLQRVLRRDTSKKIRAVRMGTERGEHIGGSGLWCPPAAAPSSHRHGAGWSAAPAGALSVDLVVPQGLFRVRTGLIDDIGDGKMLFFVMISIISMCRPVGLPSWSRN